MRLIDLRGDGALFIGYNGEYEVWIIDPEATVDAVPVRHGKWENTRPDAPMFGFYYCSLCGRKRTSPQDKYCPNCGARMNDEDN